MRRLQVFILSVISMAACQGEIEHLPSDEPQMGDMTCVRFHLEVPGVTKGVVSPNETLVNDINIYAFRDGMLVDEIYVVSAAEAVLRLPVGYTYRIYAVANMGQIHADAKESRFVDALAYSISDISDLEHGIPMSCAVSNLFVGPAIGPVKLQMERLAAKVVLSVDRSSLLNGLRVSSVRLCQSASVVRPFKWEGSGGSRIESVLESMHGDYATQDDLDQLNKGGTVVLYTLENCQGILLPENKDPLMKTLEGVEDLDKRCTYLEVSCVFDSGGLFDGHVNYRIYLGLDSTSSFDVPGNSIINIALMLTDEGFSNVSWKVEADVSICDGYVRGGIQEGMHQMNDLYVGEKLLYNVEIADDLLEYLGDEVAGCYLCYMQDGSGSDAVRINDSQWDGRCLLTEMICVRPGDGELYLYSSKGERLGCLEDRVRIKHPGIVVAENPQWLSAEPVEVMDYAPECEINGAPAEFYLYFVDEQGCNLNCGNSYGFDCTLFDFRSMGVRFGTEAISQVRPNLEVCSDDGLGHAALKLSVFCDNDGSDHGENLLLSEIFNSSEYLYVCLSENSYDTYLELSMELGIPQIRLSLVDNGWAEYHDCQLSAVVDNASNLPLQVSVWQLIATHASYGVVDKEYVENSLLRDEIFYMTGDFYNDAPPVYASLASFESERNEYGSAALEKGSLLVYPLTGISTNDLIHAIYYDRRGNHQMMHSVDVMVAGHGIGADDIVLEDSVSDGSTRYDYIYYNQDSWNYRGASLYSSGRFLSSSGVWAYDYPNLCAYKLDGLINRYDSGLPVKLAFGYNATGKKITLLTNSINVANYDMSVAVLYQGLVNGYVKTYPKGTWYEAKENKCTVEIDHVAEGIPLKVNSSYVWADDGIIYKSMAGIYDFSYLDSPKPLGADAYYHRAHPVDLNLSVSFAAEGAVCDELFPVNSSWNVSSVDYYHQQDDTNYKCSLNVDIEQFKLVVVRRR